MTVRIELADDVFSAGNIVSEWRKLAPTPMQSPDWMNSWWSAYQTPAARECVLLAKDKSDQLVGLAPFYLRDGWAFGRSVRFLGSGSVCSDFQSILTRPGYERVVPEAVADWLVDQQQQLGWSLCELDGVDREDEKLQSFWDRLAARDCRTHFHTLANTWRVDLTDGWEGFMSRLSRTQRRQSRNLINRFDKSETLSFRVASSPDDLKPSLEITEQLHQQRWTSVGQPGCFADERFGQFLLAASGQLGGQSKFSVALLEHSGRPVASLILLGDHQGLYMYQSGRDPEMDSMKIGVILNLVTIRWAAELGVPFLDYLRGDELYKSRLAAVPTPCDRARSVAPNMLSRFRYQAFEAGRVLKQSVRNG